MQAPTVPQSNTRTPLLIFAAACFGVLLYFLNSVRYGMYDEYGYSSVSKAIVKFMREEKRWPRSWTELEPHYTDLFFDLKTTRFIRQHYEVAWHIDPYELLKQDTAHPPPDDALFNYTDNIVPVIYKIRKEPPITDSTTWILHPLIHAYLSSIESTPPAKLE